MTELPEKCGLAAYNRAEDEEEDSLTYSSELSDSAESKDDFVENRRAGDRKICGVNDGSETKVQMSGSGVRDRKKKLRKEMARLRRKRDLLESDCDFLSKRIDSLRSTSDNKLESGDKMEQRTEMSDQQKQLNSSPDDVNLEPLPNKRKKLEESHDEHHHTSPIAGSAKRAIQNPLMQRLLVGTLTKSRKEIDSFKSDKTMIAKVELERKTEEKLEVEAERAKKQELAPLQAKLSHLKERLQSIQLTLMDKQNDYELLLRDDLVPNIAGELLFTKTEPHLMYRFTKSLVSSPTKPQNTN